MGYSDHMAKKTAKPKLTDAERHKRFVEMARELKTADDPKAVARILKRVAARRKNASA